MSELPISKPGSSEPLLRVTGLKKHFAIKGGLLSREVGRVHAVDGVSFAVQRGTTTALLSGLPRWSRLAMNG